MSHHCERSGRELNHSPWKGYPEKKLGRISCDDDVDDEKDSLRSDDDAVASEDSQKFLFFAQRV